MEALKPHNYTMRKTPNQITSYKSSFNLLEGFCVVLLWATLLLFVALVVTHCYHEPLKSTNKVARFFELLIFASAHLFPAFVMCIVAAIIAIFSTGLLEWLILVVKRYWPTVKVYPVWLMIFLLMQVLFFWQIVEASKEVLYGPMRYEPTIKLLFHSILATFFATTLFEPLNRCENR
jgi:hypothetical protein